MYELSLKNCFYNVYDTYTLITLLVNIKNAPKFGEMLLNNVSTDRESFIKFAQKTPEISMFLQTT